jgi:uncharacterized protein (DUF305 family)
MKKLLALVLLALTTSCVTNSEFSGEDLMFAQMMIPHHEQAIEMSDLALQNSNNAEIRDLATKIRGEQAPEIELMKSWSDSHMGSHMGHMMNGMLSDDEIRELEKARGLAFDRLFLEGMIKHHEGAIDMAEDVEDSTNNEVGKLAKSIISTQGAEIEYMKELLQRL